MTLRPDVQEFNLPIEPKKATSPFARLMHFFIKLLSAPRGDQGGWEGGARGL